MKKLFALIMTVMILVALTAPAFAQGRSRRTYDSPDSSRRNSQTYYDNSRAYYDYSNQYRGRSFWDKHRDKATMGAGTVGGAIIGGLIGGKRGAAIGALSGLGGSALYTYKLRNRGYRY